MSFSIECGNQLIVRLSELSYQLKEKANSSIEFWNKLIHWMWKSILCIDWLLGWVEGPAEGGPSYQTQSQYDNDLAFQQSITNILGRISDDDVSGELPHVQHDKNCQISKLWNDWSSKLES